MSKSPYSKMGYRCLTGSYCALPKCPNPLDNDPETTYILIPARLNPFYQTPDNVRQLMDTQSQLICLRIKYQNKIKKLTKKITKYGQRIDDLLQDLPPDTIDLFFPDEYID